MAKNHFFNHLINFYRNVPLGMVYQIYLGNSFHPSRQISLNNFNLATMFYTIFSKYNFIFSVVIQITVVNYLFL